MIPGGRMNERNMRLMMKRMGMTTDTLSDVQEVIIRTNQEDLVLESPEVTVVTVQGVKTYQIVGNPKSRPRGSAGSSEGAPSVPATPAGPPEEDITLVMEQAQVDRTAAIQALREAQGEPAEAILRLMSRRSG
jgi:nascent polypeptide-associated complex subunit alpha